MTTPKSGKVTLPLEVQAIVPFRTQSIDPFHVDGLGTFEDALERAAQALRIARLIRAGMDSEEFEDGGGCENHDLLQSALWVSEHCLDEAFNDRLLLAVRDRVAAPKDGA